MPVIFKPIKVLDTDKKGSTQGYQWVYHNPVEKLVLFYYRKGRGQHGRPKELLADYTGYLQCDGYSVYDKIGADPNIVLVGCLVHARRKFNDALDSDRVKAEHYPSLGKSIRRSEL